MSAPHRWINVVGLACLLAACASVRAEDAPPTDVSAVDAYNLKHVKMWRTIMDPKRVADAFGKRIGQKYVAVQITVANLHSDYQWLITDASVDIEELIARLQQSTECSGTMNLLQKSAQSMSDANRQTTLQISSADLTVLRGVAEKGQYLDTRNMTLRSLQGAGTVAAGLLGITTFGPAFAPAVAAFNGPLISAFQTVFPDETFNQLNRLNDSAFLANSVVGKQQARVLVVFVPQSYFFTPSEQKRFYKDPTSVYACADLRLLNASVDGHFIASVDVAPVVTTVSIAESEAVKFASDNFNVAGRLVGRFLDKTNTTLLRKPDGLTLEVVGEPAENEVQFKLSSARPLSPGQTIRFNLEKPGIAKGVTAEYTVAYQAQRPALQAGGLNLAEVNADSAPLIEITGSNFLPGAEVRIEPDSGIKVGSVTVESSTLIKVQLNIDASVPDGRRALTVYTKAAGVSDPLFITVKKKQ